MTDSTDLDSTDLDSAEFRDYDDIVERLRSGYSRAEFRPRSAAPARGLTPRSVAACGAGLALGLLAVTSVTGLPGLPGSEPAAAWSATPSTVGIGDRGEVDELCRDAFTIEFAPQLPIEDAAGNRLPDPGPTGRVDEMLAIEARGDYGLAIYAGVEQDAPRLLTCLTRTGSDGHQGVLALWGGPAVSARTQSTVEVLGGSSGALDKFAVAFGTVDPSVARLEIAAPNASVEATVTGGYFLAFWPEADDAAVPAVATDADGTVVWSGEVLAAAAGADEPER